MLGLIRYITSFSPLLITLFLVCLFFFCGGNWNKHLFTGTPLHRQIRSLSKEFKENFLTCYTKISCPSRFDTVMLDIGDCSTFVVNRNFKASSPAKCVPATNVICKDTDIFHKDNIYLRTL